MSRPSASELAVLLGDRIDDLVRTLLPAVKFCGHYWHCGDVQGNPGKSLFGKRGGLLNAGRFRDAATGQYGDALDLIEATLGLSKLEAMDWARGYLGITETKNYDPERAKRRKVEQQAKAKAEREKSTKQAHRTWMATTALSGSYGETYLREARGYTGLLPDSLRFHRELYNAETGQRMAAVVARLQAVDDSFLAIMRIYLEADGSDKAAVSCPKKALGPIGGGAVRLAEAAEEMAIAEGIESGLSYQQLTGLPTWAGLSTGGIEALVLPPLPLARVVVIACDNDQPGIDAANGAAERWRAEGREVRIDHPDEPNTDWNDVLTRNPEALDE